MKIDVEKLINIVSKNPPIYNPDHKDFANKEIRDNIFNTVISKEMNGIKGELLSRKWDKILNKYASFIRKLSNDDSSETVLERFMEWPWTKNMRIFKPYVRKQFQIPEFQPAVLIPEMNPEDLPPNFSNSMDRFEISYTSPTSESRIPMNGNISHSTVAPELPRGTPPINRIQIPAFMENVLMTAIGSEINVGNNQSIIQNIVSMMGLDQPSGDEDMDTDENNDTDDEIETDEEAGDGQSIAKKSKQEESSEKTESNTEEHNFKENSSTDNGESNKKNESDVLPDLPQPKLEVKRSSDFTAQEHIFLAWAKTMSTFTAKRQATIKMKINKIMSEAEFEDLDDEFFAAKTPPRRNIYTSRQ